MFISEYMREIEGAFDQPGTLERLLERAGSDPDLTDGERGDVELRVGVYLGEQQALEGEAPLLDPDGGVGGVSA